MRDWIIIFTPETPFERMVEYFCDVTVCSRDELLGFDRSAWLMDARVDLMVALHDQGRSYHEIGRLVGDRENGSVSRSIRRARRRRSKKIFPHGDAAPGVDPIIWQSVRASMLEGNAP